MENERTDDGFRKFMFEVSGYRCEGFEPEIITLTSQEYGENWATLLEGRIWDQLSVFYMKMDLHVSQNMVYTGLGDTLRFQRTPFCYSAKILNVDEDVIGSVSTKIWNVSFVDSREI